MLYDPRLKNEISESDVEEEVEVIQAVEDMKDFLDDIDTSDVAIYNFEVEY